ncbi:sugar transferase [Roseimaritima sediminicola]|uniref:sugar transferase n=1 Tax=Roseimaritima sediminicola TaxID=2662066 RepID=UPI00138712FF|nr:sugar transferase [Roseimaritima sediminicola]
MLLDAPPPLTTAPAILKRATPGWKRAVDLAGVAILMPLLMPLFAAVAVFIKVVSPGPVLFRQRRLGHGGETFWIYKFRTMHVSPVSRDQGHRDYLNRQAGSDAPNRKPDYLADLIPGGQLLRKLSIDELPQLLNVARGEMSLVGPRPDLMQIADYQPVQLRRFEVLPGMTGLWQVSGKNRLTFEQMIELDIRYIENRSLHLDLQILLRTVRVLVQERNE